MNFLKPVLIFLICFTAMHVEAKEIYIPSSFGAMDLNNNNSQWCYQRSKESDNFIIFWEKGYGLNPLLAAKEYKVNISGLLKTAEISFQFYTDSLQFIHPGNSRTDEYKMIILLFYNTDWLASGSGVDDVIGQLNLSANAAQNAGVTLAHEVGHCFQYQVKCDGYTGGWRYGFGPNGSGGNGWWEQCAQWQAFKVYPSQQFSNYQFQNYLNNRHKNVWHEEPRYANYFIPDYWSYLHGINFVGRLWQESKYPEDPVRAYQRMTGITHDEFNDEMFDCAARFVTWDIASIKERGENYIQQNSSSQLIEQEDNSWAIAPEQCIENYGYNTIRLNVPKLSSNVSIYFEGLAGADGYRMVYRSFAGWRYGLVALLDDGTRVYSEVQRPKYTSKLGNPKDTLAFSVPENCDKLWLVVSGAPQIHWPHAWDDNDDNDEQWPYKVKFANTNVYGEYSFGDNETPIDNAQTHFLTLKPESSTSNPYPSVLINPDWELVCQALKLSKNDIKSAIGTRIKFCAVLPTETYNYNSTANAPGHWFSRLGYTTNWGNQSFIFSEFNAQNLTFSIGQYPGLCKLGDKFIVRQALIYTPEKGDVVEALFEFQIDIGEEISTSLPQLEATENSSSFLRSQQGNILHFKRKLKQVNIHTLNGRKLLYANNCDQLDVSQLHPGIYLLTGDNKTIKIRISH